MKRRLFKSPYKAQIGDLLDDGRITATSLHLHTKFLAEIMARLHGGEWRIVIDHDAGFILIDPALPQGTSS